MAPSLPDKSGASDHHRSVAMKHANILEHQKSTRNTVLDLIVNVVDLPTKPDSDPAHPLASDAALFKRGLHIFQPSDFDDVVLERNIYDKCGYGLCPRPNVKVEGRSQNRIIWGKRSGPAFTVVPKADLEKWCSAECGERALFVRAQLGTEPAWMREKPIEDIKFLDEVRQAGVAENLENSMSVLNIEGPKPAQPSILDDLRKLALERGLTIKEGDNVTKRLEQLSLERGEPHNSRGGGEMQVVEKLNTEAASPPPQLTQGSIGNVEGYKPRKDPLVAKRASAEELGEFEDDLGKDDQSSQGSDAMSL